MWIVSTGDSWLSYMKRNSSIIEERFRGLRENFPQLGSAAPSCRNMRSYLCIISRSSLIYYTPLFTYVLYPALSYTFPYFLCACSLPFLTPFLQIFPVLSIPSTFLQVLPLHFPSFIYFLSIPFLPLFYHVRSLPFLHLFIWPVPSSPPPFLCVLFSPWPFHMSCSFLSRTFSKWPVPSFPLSL